MSKEHASPAMLPASDPTQITALLRDSRSDAQAREAVYRLVYQDLRRLAGHRIASSRPGETLSVTSLVNEAYLKLTERTGPGWNDRSHFLRVAARAMRQITVDAVRARLAGKRGAGKSALPLEGLELPASEKSEMVLALEEGLTQLSHEDPRLVDVVECRFYSGMTIPQTAEALAISPKTVERDWERARDWLKDFMT
ncbi:MAG: ECF-type sigma factor [Lysobacterales bacterium]